MISLEDAPVREHPFPHVLVDGWLDQDFYSTLAGSFPTCPAQSGPTGYTLHWGDSDYDRLITTEPAWAALFHQFHSQAFIDYVLRQFASVFRDQGTVDLSGARYVPYRESRADKERPALARVEHEPDELWVRMDVMQGRDGYTRAPHLDHRRRAISMLLYFCDAAENGMEGGDLMLHGPEGEVEAIRPRHNRMVMFPCHNHSLHSVSPIVRQDRPRDFVQVTVSSSVDLWPEPGGWTAKLGRRLRRGARRLLN